jgi:energy-coupling factor transporter ATP-binding protein EcfA2
VTEAAHRQVLLILDVDDDLFAAEVGPALPEGASREVLSLSQFGAPHLHRATRPEEPVDWPVLCDTVKAMAARARALRIADGTPAHYYICGKAPLPLFLLLARELAARSEPQTFVGWSREAGWGVFPLTASVTPKGGFFDVVRGLSEATSNEPPRRGMVALFVSTLGGPAPGGMLRDLIQREGEDVAGVVEVRTSAAVFVEPEDVSAATGQLAGLLSQLALFYPDARGVAVFVAGPALLAFLVGRLLPGTVGEVWFANHRPFFKDYERAYASPRNPRFAVPASGDFSPILRNVSIRGVRGLDRLAFDLPAPEPGAAQHVLVLGENGTGKTTLLRALAFAFLDPKITDVALQQSVSPYRSTRGVGGVSECVVETDQGVFHTELGTRDALETATARPTRENRRPFVLAYGCRRGSATGSLERDPAATPFDDVGNLFDRPWGLVHAEAWLRNLHAGGEEDSPFYESVSRAVLRVLPGVDALFFVGSTLRARGPAIGEVDFAALSDGYLTTAGLVVDIIYRWKLRAARLGCKLDANFTDTMRGVVLVDEIDLHLHPVWQMRVLTDLRSAFPKLTFIGTTHNPITLVGTRDVVVLRREGGRVTATRLDEDARLMTASQIYRAFFGITDLFPHGLGEKLRRYGLLAGDPTRTDDQDAEVKRLRAELKTAGVDPGWDPVEREPPPGETT